jgi:hypothetical protein
MTVGVAQHGNRNASGAWRSGAGSIAKFRFKNQYTGQNYDDEHDTEPGPDRKRQMRHT